MTTRQELRARQQPKTAEVVHEKAANHHVAFCWWNSLLLALTVLLLLINVTLLNPQFIKQEITNSSLESLILDQVNSGLNQYGISTSVLKKKTTDTLVNQAIDQIYAGEKIKLDSSPVVNNIGSSVNSQLAQYGLSTSMLPQGSETALTTEINDNLNAQLNTTEVSQVTKGIQIAKATVRGLLVINIILLVIMLIKSLWQHHLLTSWRWCGLFSLILYGLLLFGIRALAIQLSSNDPDLSPFVNQVANDFTQVGIGYGGGILVITMLLFGGSFLKLWWQNRH